jgi:CO/xanthine dehydrogenase Mo-binding subunit
MQRREFLSLSAIAGGGLLVSGVLPIFSHHISNAVVSSNDELAKTVELGYFLKITPENRILFQLTKHEMGQSVSTGLAMMFADELGAEWSRVSVEFIDNDKRYSFGTGGSTTIMSLWEPLRKVAATTRTVLVQTAAKKWGVPHEECTVEKTAVLHTTTNKRLSFGEIATDAAKESLPPLREIAASAPKLKNAKDFSIIGTAQKNTTSPKIVRGELKYSSDVYVEGMLFAALLRCPVYHGKLKRFSAEKARKFAGVRDVLAIEGYHGIDKKETPLTGGFPFVVRDSVAVLASSTWAAFEGKKLLDVEWDTEWDTKPTAVAKHTTQTFRDFTRTTLQANTTPKGLRGKPDEILRSANSDNVKLYEAEYEYPYQTHSPMETLNCTAHFRADGSCEVWVGTQSPSYIVQEITRTLGIPSEKITIHLFPSGGGFGRRFFPDYAIEALLVSKSAGNLPVKVVWSREDDVQTNHYHHNSLALYKAAMTEKGDITAWQMTEGRTYWSRPQPSESSKPPEKDEITWNGYTASIVNMRHDNVDVQSPSVFPSCSWRSVIANAWAFGQECFIDELAHAAQQDPYLFRRNLLKEISVDVGHQFPLDNKRLRGVLDLAASKAGWGKTPLPKGHGCGIAAYPYMHGNSYCAVVVEVEVRGKNIRVQRVVCAVDCGLVVHPDGVRQQIEGGVIWGLTAALYGGLEFEVGRILRSNYHDNPLLRFQECPKIEVHFVPQSMEKPTGVGELSPPPTVPALCNAIFDATGKRIRRLPVNL